MTIPLVPFWLNFFFSFCSIFPEVHGVATIACRGPTLSSRCPHPDREGGGDGSRQERNVRRSPRFFHSRPCEENSHQGGGARGDNHARINRTRISLCNDIKLVLRNSVFCFTEPPTHYSHIGLIQPDPPERVHAPPDRILFTPLIAPTNRKTLCCRSLRNSLPASSIPR